MKIIQYNQQTFLSKIKFCIENFNLNDISCDESIAENIIWFLKFNNLEYIYNHDARNFNQDQLIEKTIFLCQNNFPIIQFLEILLMINCKFSKDINVFFQKHAFDLNKNLTQIIAFNNLNDELRKFIIESIKIFEKMSLELLQESENTRANIINFIKEFLLLALNDDLSFDDFGKSDKKNQIISIKLQNRIKNITCLFILDEKINPLTIINQESQQNPCCLMIDENNPHLRGLLDIHSDQHDTQQPQLSHCSSLIEKKYNSILYEENLKTFNLNKNIFVNLYEKVISKNTKKITNLSTHALKKFFCNEENFLKEHRLSLGTKKYLSNDFFLHNNFQYSIKQIIKQFLLLKINRHDKQNINLIAQEFISKNYHPDYQNFFLHKAEMFFDNFINFHTDIINKHKSINFCISNSIDVNDISVDGFAFYVVFEQKTITLIDIFYKNVTMKNFYNLLQPKTIPLAIYYRNKYKDYEIDLNYFCNDKLHKVKNLPLIIDKFHNKIENLNRQSLFQD